MRLSFVLAVVAVLTTSISADQCPYFCWFNNSQCKGCPEPLKCILFICNDPLMFIFVRRQMFKPHTPEAAVAYSRVWSSQMIPKHFNWCKRVIVKSRFAEANPPICDKCHCREGNAKSSESLIVPLEYSTNKYSESFPVVSIWEPIMIVQIYIAGPTVDCYDTSTCDINEGPWVVH
ncbi:hypothetical protein BD769DRAFT_1399870 [Suillus cothurnatus]|nr:hypothetical protein BD769DRAFT_1399870 [Suillus cothurnatus]